MQISIRKIHLLIFILIISVSSKHLSAQVFGYPGAKWTFGREQWNCLSRYQTWEYIGDTTILGYLTKKLHCTQKLSTFFVPPYSYNPPTHTNYFFHVGGDTVSFYHTSDSTWWELYNFSYSIGDLTPSPLKHPFNYYFNQCPDTSLYNFPALVIDTGHTIMSGQSLRYYTVHYLAYVQQVSPTDWDSTWANRTFYERVITLDQYWFPDDNYGCGTVVVECGGPDFICYQDNDILTDSLCIDLNWFETLNISEEKGYLIKIYPNPSNALVNFQFGSKENLQLLIFDLLGKQVFSKEIQNSTQVNVETWPKGIYLYQLITKGVLRGSGKFIVE
jgi:hypothetical protein